MRHVYTFSIAELKLKLETPFPIYITEAFQPFVTSETEQNITVSFRQGILQNRTAKSIVYKDHLYSVCSDENGFYKIFHSKKEGHALSHILSDQYEEVLYQKEYEHLFQDSRSCFMHLSYENLLLRNGAIVLHSSFIDSKYGGILFCGPSGIGKSTQAELWSRYQNAEIINGDRTVMRKTSGIWRAYGSPYAGSSHYYRNQSSKIKAVFLLQKAEKNMVKKLGNPEAFRRLYSQISVNFWDPECVNRSMDFIENLIKEIPVYIFCCTPDQYAVDFLDKVLEKERTCGKK